MIAGTANLRERSAMHEAAANAHAECPEGNENVPGASTMSWMSQTSNGLSLPTTGFSTRSATIYASAIARMTDAPILLRPDASSRAAMATQQSAWAETAATAVMGASKVGDAPCIHIRMSSSSTSPAPAGTDL